MVSINRAEYCISKHCISFGPFELNSIEYMCPWGIDSLKTREIPSGIMNTRFQFTHI